MQAVVDKVNAKLPKCPECKGTGKLLKLWPLYAISMPHELAWQLKPCWRCKGTGELQPDDYYTVTAKVSKRCCNAPFSNADGSCANCGAREVYEG